MTPFPLPLTEMFGPVGVYIVYLLIGAAFGATLELAGFGDSRRLAAQFYFKDLTVLKVMFGAIVVAMLLIFLASGMGLLDFNKVWVNPTYMLPGIVGGLIMGVGFIIGGFCPGTSLVSAAAGKLDGLLFALGAAFGIFLFGETVGGFEGFFNSTFMGRLTIFDWLNVPVGVVVLVITLMALVVFWGSEWVEKKVGGAVPGGAPRWRIGAALGAAALGVGVLLIGQPDLADRWERIAPTAEATLSERKVQIEPMELLTLMNNHRVMVDVIDVRSESDYNRFHILDSRHVPLSQLAVLVEEQALKPADNKVFVLVSNDETAATEGWKLLQAASVPNVYLLEGGMNKWIATFGAEELAAYAIEGDLPADSCAYAFPASLGSRYEAAFPPIGHYKDVAFTPKVVLKTGGGPKGGGCG